MSAGTTSDLPTGLTAPTVRQSTATVRHCGSGDLTE
nr:MAG TPA: hypothetical protein [Bacteriophage sp.]